MKAETGSGVASSPKLGFRNLDNERDPDTYFSALVEMENARISAAWARAGISWSGSELGGERLYNFLAHLSKIEERFHDL